MKPKTVKSESSDHPTPDWVFILLDRIFAFTLDVAASRSNNKCKHFFTESDDALAQQWSGRCWMNPPYGKGIERWVEKASREVESGNAYVVVGLLPARTSASWYHDYVMPKAVVIPVKGRLKFLGNNDDAMFASLIAIWFPQISKESATSRGIDTSVREYCPEVISPLHQAIKFINKGD